tara:strand:- start:260 stop:526 length:267 start_codon:yes stop_codon:yes gene_type:complete
MTMHTTARLTFDFEHRCAIINGVTKKTMFPDQVVDRLEISMTGRWFRLYGSDAEIKRIDCDSVDQFMRVLEVAKVAEEIDKEIKVVYV